MAATACALALSAPHAWAGQPGQQQAPARQPAQVGAPSGADQPPDEAAGLILTFASADAANAAEVPPPTRALAAFAADRSIELAAPEQIGPGTYAVRSSQVLSGSEARALAAEAAAVPGVTGAFPDYRYEVYDSPATLAANTASPARAQPTAAQIAPPWNLDRIDQRSGTNGYYRYDTTGAGVLAYVVDTGIRATVNDFGGRVAGGVSVLPGGSTNDCIGHGTHVAGTIGAATYGVAKGVTLVPVALTDCSGAIYASDFVDGLYWVASHHTTQPAVLNASIGGPALDPVDAAVRAVIADGVTFVAASGNSSRTACDRSPARVPEVIVVNSIGKNDVRSDFSNFGSCTDIYAPGEDIVSTGTYGDDSNLTASGTSMAAPHVAGAVAKYLQSSPKASPAAVWWYLAVTATPVNPAPWDPTDSKRLLFVHSPVPAPVITSATVGNGSAQVSFTQPPDPGGPQIVNYLYNLQADTPGSEWIARSPSGTTSPLVITGLTNGTTYRLALRAETTEYPGLPSTTKPITPAVPPGVPTGLSATPSDAAAWIGFTPPASDGGSHITTYQYSLTNGASWLDLVPAQPTPPVLVTGLANGTPHSIRLRAVNAKGPSPASESVSVTPAASADALFVPLPPTRAVDTRLTGGPVAAGAPRLASVALGDAVPSGATAVVYNLTATGQTRSGFASVVSGDVPDTWTPSASTINWVRAGQTIANGHMVKISPDRTIKMFVGGAGTAHLTLDVAGYFLPGDGQASAFVPITPVRGYSSVGGDGPMVGPTSVPRQLDLSAVVPAAATAIAYNLTVTGTSGSGYLALAPAGGPKPNSSAINWGVLGAPLTIANGSVVPVADQAVDVYLGGSGKAHVILDVVGYYMPVAALPPGESGAAFHPLDAIRAYDSRIATPGERLAGTPGGVGAPRNTSVSAGGTVPPQARAIAYNLTATLASGSGFLSVGPDASTYPGASALNWTPWTSTIANGSTVATANDQRVAVWAGGPNATHYVIDLGGYYTPLPD